MVQPANVNIYVPFSLCDLVVTDKFFAPFRLYLFLKSTSYGQLKITLAKKQELAAALHVTVRTINNLLHQLQERNWIGHNTRTGWYFVRGFMKIGQLEGLTGKQAVELDVHKDLSSKEKFQAFVVGAIIGRFARSSRYKWREQHKRGSEYNKGNSKHNPQTAPSFFPVSCESIRMAKDPVHPPRMSLSTAWKYKQLAHKYGFIDLKQNLVRLPLGKDESECDAPFAGAYKKANPEVADRVRIIDGKVYLQEPDLVQERMRFVRKWKFSKNISLSAKRHS
ncbi:MAG: hypothetical protein SFV55_08100 [Haliscomenobacter sp.]|uniref:hypothetical protein n=1 Tax=Haliscomenobacter sp. TaxID=2717303 RepID=UPI0029B82DF7|nr:hypothetical protein [Haliscomenobacter sp.]MDX2068374.1 hypothetical protein [Haliscomenobacter sp.]